MSVNSVPKTPERPEVPYHRLFKLEVMAVASSNVPCPTSTHSVCLQRLFSGAKHRRVSAHAHVVVATPDKSIWFGILGKTPTFETVRVIGGQP